MSKFTIPNSAGQIRQVNRGDVFGELWETFGIDLTSSIGKLKTSTRLAPTISTTASDNADWQTGCIFDGSIYWYGDNRRAIIGAERNPRISGSWTAGTISFDVGQESDSVVFNEKLLVSTGTNIAMSTNGSTFDNDWWTTVNIGGETGSALTVGVPHTMDVSLVGHETVFVTNGNKVHYANESAGHSTVTLPAHLVACSIATDPFATWVGTYSNSGDAYVYEIYVGETLDSTPVARRSYRIKGASAVLSMDVSDDGVPYLVTDKGYIHVYNGRSFVPVAQFPFASKGYSLAGLSLGNVDDDNIVRAIHPKGMRADGKSLLININTDNQLITDLASNPDDNDDVFNNYVVDERSPSGVWEFNIETGTLNHIAPLTNDSSQNGFHRHQSSGPILVTNNQYTRFLTTSRVQSDRTDIYAEDPTTTPFGYFVTSEIQSDSILDAWEQLAIQKDILNSETISVKYRTSKRASMPKYGLGTWTKTNTVVVSEDISSIIEDGDLVEVIDGYGAGKIAHVSSSTSSSTTTTITLDTAIGSIGEASTVRFRNFKTFSLEDNANYDSGGTAETSTWVQFMVVLNGMVEVRQLLSKGNANGEV